MPFGDDDPHGHLLPRVNVACVKPVPGASEIRICGATEIENEIDVIILGKGVRSENSANTV
jgi:hypothetical protein